ncbi:putative O-methyltransferase [Streptomyces sp. ADI96-02]|uniref:O-methyltransferase n=1 Tax=unclassified Streptomyces TaxID=2593676 RepID=UPI000F54E7EC|nr:class I SAM-dependent methyltransferase [Streptomyces sp. ADI96-02]RPK69068.1 putative O-methyltransferase [Streptomyces sp. ADI96-02]
MPSHAASGIRTVAIAAIAAVRRPVRTDDPFADVQAATRLHRRRHRCGAFAYGDGSLPATVAAATGARRIVEVGTALGYTALSMAATVPGARVDTIEADDQHVRLARATIAGHGPASRVTVMPGRAEEVLPTLAEAEYDLAFFDGFAPTLSVVRGLHRLLRPGGSLIVGNLILGPERAAADHLGSARLWQTHVFGETALCVKRAAPEGEAA